MAKVEFGLNKEDVIVRKSGWIRVIGVNCRTCLFVFSMRSFAQWGIMVGEIDFGVKHFGNTGFAISIFLKVPSMRA